jgi:two-component system cell cycle response regulator
MSGRILITGRIATEAAQQGRTLVDAGFECDFCPGFEGILARLPDPGVDLVLAELPEGDTGPKEITAFLARLRAMPGGERLPVVVQGHWTAGATRLALLEAGADEVAAAPVSSALMQARIRNLMRARDTLEELARREATHRMLGFSEAAPGFTSRPRTTLIAPERVQGTLVDARHLLCAPRHVGPQGPFAAATREEDLFVIDGAALRAAGAPSRELFRIVAELRSRSATRRAAQLVLLPEPGREAAMLLDLGADDIVPAAVTEAEIGFRARRLLHRKTLADRLRATERHGLEAALTDALTGLWNRRYALPHLARLITEARRRDRPLAVMLLDIDLFKAVNDRHGHAAGDAVLAQVAARLRDGLRPADLIARIGGEEFLVAMPDATLDQARRAAERLRRRIRERPFDIGGSGHPALQVVTVSVGVALGPGPAGAAPDMAAEALMRRADAALYAAKRTGRNRVTVSLSAA